MLSALDEQGWPAPRHAAKKLHAAPLLKQNLRGSPLCGGRGAGAHAAAPGVEAFAAPQTAASIHAGTPQQIPCRPGNRGGTLALQV